MKYFESFFPPLLFCVLAIFALSLGMFKPKPTWDIIAYMAAAKSFEEHDIKVIHSFAYEQLRNTVSAEKYEDLVHTTDNYPKDDYRQGVSQDPSALQEQLPFYKIRPIYISMIYLLYKIGIPIGFAIHLISGLAIAVAIVLLYFISKSFLWKPFVYAVPVLIITFGVLDVARFSTPDGLAFLGIIISVYLYLNKQIKPLLIFLPIVIAIRTDFILFVIPLLFFIFFDKRNRYGVILSGLIAVITYIGIGFYWSNPGWATIFSFTFVKYLTHPISSPPTLTIGQYFSVLLIECAKGLESKTFTLYILMTAYSLYLIKSQTKTSLSIMVSSPIFLLTFTCLIFVASHFLLFPAIWDRFFCGPYVIQAFSLLYAISNKARDLNLADQITHLQTS